MIKGQLCATYLFETVLLLKLFHFYIILDCHFVGLLNMLSTAP